MNSVSRETEGRFRTLHELVVKWNKTINLVAPNSIADFEVRHLEDSLQLAKLAHGASGRWVDLGSGGGFPGLVAAIALEDEDLEFFLIESDRRKAVFLRNAAREMSLSNVKIIAERIEELPPQEANVTSARALAPLDVLVGLSHRHMAKEGVAWFMKGKNWREELRLAQVRWSFSFEVFPSTTNSEAAVIRIAGVTDA